MEMSLAAYRLLVSIAAAQGGVGKEEEELLARYRRAFGLRSDLSQGGAERDADEHLWREASAEQRAHLVKMLARVAWADGEIGRRERRMLREAAGRVGLSRMELGSILVAVEDEVRRHHRGRGRRWALGACAVLAAAGLGWALALRTGDTGMDATFKVIEERVRPSLVLIQVDYELRAGTRRSKRRSTGSGFFLRDDGLIATNKHVLEPWKFAGEPARLAALGYTLVDQSVRIVAYPVGTRVVDKRGKRVTDGAYDSRAGTLRVVSMAPDRLEPQHVVLAGQRSVEHALHANDSSDLALLQATPSGVVTALTLRDPDAPVQTLEAVLVIGFPDGTEQLELGLANPTVVMGKVSKVEDTLLIQAPLLPGTSGGPVLDAAGRVLGIATRTLPSATFGRCIRSQHIRALCLAQGPTGESGAGER